jgi:hypothetical protein
MQGAIGSIEAKAKANKAEGAAPVAEMAAVADTEHVAACSPGIFQTPWVDLTHLSALSYESNFFTSFLSYSTLSPTALGPICPSVFKA